MKTRRRIEITAFRRRTTIVLRDRSEVCPTGRPHVDGESPSPIRTGPARAAEIGLDQTQITIPDAGQFRLHQGQDGNDPKST